MRGGLCGVQQEPPVRQRHLWQLQLTPPRQHQPTDTVGSGGSYTARLQPHVTKGGTTQSPQHAWWPSCTPSGPLHGHQTGSEPNHAHGRHVEHGSLPQTHTEPQAVTVLAQPRHSAGQPSTEPQRHLVSTQPSTGCTSPPSPLPHHPHEYARAGAAQAALGAKRARERMGTRCLHSPTRPAAAGPGTRAPQESAKQRGRGNGRNE